LQVRNSFESLTLSISRSKLDTGIKSGSPNRQNNDAPE